tara:strand:+ start:232 stop:483 length:252 start_codon:yes stop_codon:yes gene_type:complete
MNFKEFTAAVAVQSLKSKVPTDFRFEETKISIDLDMIVWYKQYWHIGTDKFKESHTEVCIAGINNPVILVIGYEDLKKIMNDS